MATRVAKYKSLLPPPKSIDNREGDYDRCLALNQRVASQMGVGYVPEFLRGNVWRKIDAQTASIGRN